METKLIVLIGPTCSGKTFTSLRLAERLNGEIISADSRQIYKFLNIGTAKPDATELQRIQHHFIDYLYPDEDYNVSRFEKEALIKINQIQSEGKIPILTGGSGLYIKAVVDGIVDDVDTDYDYRAELLEFRKNYGNDALYERLLSTDKAAAAAMLPQNWKRVIRALEVYKLSGKSILEFHSGQSRNLDINFIQYGLNWERSKLYENINKRVDKMIETGLVEEVRNLLNADYDASLNSLNSVGYKEIIAYLNNEFTLDRAVELIKRNTRRYAKRQMTWFNKDKRINWIEVENLSSLENVVDFLYNEMYN